MSARTTYRHTRQFPNLHPSPATVSWPAPTDEELQSETAGESTNIFNLEKYTNYSISVLAYTSAGDGVPSSPVFCRTLQDGEMGDGSLVVFTELR